MVFSLLQRLGSIWVVSEVVQITRRVVKEDSRADIAMVLTSGDEMSEEKHDTYMIKRKIAVARLICRN